MSALAAAAVAVANPAPASAEVGPTITGTAQQGQTLTADPGTWAGTTTGYRFQWEHCDASGIDCSPIAGATSQTYTLAATDVGMTIVVEVWNGVGSSTIGPEVSSPTAFVLSAGPVNITPPQVEVSHTEQYSFVPGTWTGDPTSYAHQWVDCTNLFNPTGPTCTPIPGQTGPTYTPGPSDVGSSIAVWEWATNADGTNGPVLSTYTYPYVAPPTYVAPPPAAPPTSSALPSITGATTVGSMLTASIGAWTAAAGLSITYGFAWDRCDSSGCSAIAGATGSTYTPTSADIGDKLEVVVDAADSWGSNDEASGMVGPVTEPRFSTASTKRFERALDGAIAPRAPEIGLARLLRAGGFAAAISAMPPGRLSVTWSATVPGTRRTTVLGRGSVEVPDSGDATLRLVLSRSGRALLRKTQTLRVRARATLLVVGELPIEATATFTLAR